MLTIIYSSTALLMLATAAIKSIRFQSSRLTNFELHRQAEQQDRAALAELQLRQERPLLVTLQTIIIFLLIVIITLLIGSVYNPQITLGLVLLGVLIIELLSSRQFVRKVAEKAATKQLANIFTVIKILRPALRLMSDKHANASPTATFYSKDELLHMIEHDHGVLSATEQALIQQALTYRHLKIIDVMAPRASVMSLQKTDSLGPLMLDSLHKSGQLHFPVVDKTIKNIVGIVSMADVLPLRPEVTSPADVMTSKVYYIPGDMPLDAVLLSFLKTSQHLFIVVNELEETIGVISIETILQQIIGQPNLDEFEQYTDRRAVAKPPRTRS